MKKLVLIISLLLLFSNLSVCSAQSLSYPQKTELTKIAMMYYQEKSQPEIKSAWENFIRSNSKINIDDALSYLKQEVKRIGDERLQKAKQDNSQLRKLKIQEVSQGNQDIAEMLAQMSKAMYDEAIKIIDNMKA